jgi:hypothetical protein
MRKSLQCVWAPVAGIPTNGTTLQRRFSRLVKAVGVKCEQTDFGAWVACVTRAQIMDFISHEYRGKADLPWVVDSLMDPKMFVSELGETKGYGPVAAE